MTSFTLPTVPRCSGLALLLAAALSACPVQAQERWQEVEIVVFTHEDRASQVSERPLGDPSRLAWLPRLTTLNTLAASLYYPFEEEAAAQLAAEQQMAGFAMPLAGAAFPVASAPIQPALPAPVFGPEAAPQQARSFRLPDLERDAFIALDDSIALLDQDVRRLQGSDLHRVLWHGTWRQPLLPAGHSQAVLVRGGEAYGDRHELEGSLRVSDSGGRSQLELHLWFSSFMAGFSTTAVNWSLPPLPALLAAEAGSEEDAVAEDASGSWLPTSSWQLRDGGLLTLDATHYYDNPAIGVIVQVRPYTVPPREVPGVSEDF
jgi:hypothetical protein